LLLLLLLPPRPPLLLQVESEAVAAADVLGAAKGLLVSQPEGLLQRLVLQVMQLLSVERLEGLPAAVNRVSTLWGISEPHEVCNAFYCVHVCSGDNSSGIYWRILLQKDADRQMHMLAA
jgi:hypothetical protein